MRSSDIFATHNFGQVSPWVDLVNSEECDGFGNFSDRLDDPAWLESFLGRWHLHLGQAGKAPLPALKSLRRSLRGVAEALSASGVPDVGLLTLTEFADEARRLTAATSLPLLCDADTGFGEALNVERTVQVFESAGAAGIHLEDQLFPKRCGHLAGKSLVEPAVMAAKIRALFEGRFAASIDDVRQVCFPALRHRVLLNFEGEAEGIRTDQVIEEILARTPEAKA